MNRKMTLAISAIALALLASFARAEAPADPLVLHIEAQPMGAALKELADRAGLQLVYPDEVVDPQLMAPALEGRFTAAEALTRLLVGSGLSYHFINPQTVSIRSVASEDRKISGVVPPSGGAVLRLAQSSSETGQASGAEAEKGAVEPAALELLDEVVVTGTHIKGRPITSAPRIEFNREEILRSGALTTEAFLGTLPQNFGGGRNGVADKAANSFDTNVNNTNGTTVNLRGLAAGSTLTLVNGRRMAPASSGGDFDISVIPSGAIERVEIVTDGASAIYGSDAIAGVVNFVLRDHFEGAETQLRYSDIADSNYREVTADQVFGHDWSSGGALLSYEYYDRNALSSADRDYSEPLVSDASLVDPETRHSFVFSGRQEASERIALRLDALYTEREGRTKVSFADDFFQDYGLDYLTLAPSVTLQLPKAWSLELSGVYGKTQEVVVARISGFPIPFGFDSRLKSLDLVLNGTPLKLPAGNVSVAFGAGYRQEEAQGTELAASPLSKRNVRAVFAEALVPLIGEHTTFAGIEEAQLSLALRHEDYSDFGTTTDPRIGLALSPTAGLTLRGTWGTSFKAPRQSLDSADDALVISDTFDATLGADTLVFTRSGILPGTGPETAESWTVGFDWQPPQVRGLKINMTYYDVAFDDRIATPAFFPADFLAQPLIYGDFVSYDPTVAQVSQLLDTIDDVSDFTADGFDRATESDDVHALIDARIRNIAASKTRGYDFSVDYDRLARGGVLTLLLNANYVREFSNQPVPGGPVADDLDVIYRPLKLRTRAGVSWSNPRWSLNAFVNYAGSYTNSIAAPDEKIDSYLTLDTHVGYRFEAPGTVLEGLSAQLTVRNLFNEEPPFVSTPLNGNFYDGANADPFGRIVALGLLKQW